MGYLKIYGHSDDLVEIEGDVEDEIGCYKQDVEILVSDGTVIVAQYRGAFWRLTVEKTGEGTTLAHAQATDEDKDYSDVVELKNATISKFRIGTRTGSDLL